MNGTSVTTALTRILRLLLCALLLAALVLDLAALLPWPVVSGGARVLALLNDLRAGLKLR